MVSMCSPVIWTRASTFLKVSSPGLLRNAKLSTRTLQCNKPLWILRPSPLLSQSKKVFHIITRSGVSIAKEIVEEIHPKASKWVGTWLIGCSAMVVGSVVLGGITRLTKSGLSMVDWHLFKEFPPLSKLEWEKEFKKYQQYPEFKQHNAGMTLEEFRWIWFMEYAHRMWGRSIGAMFLIPAVFFWRKNCFTKAMKKRVVAFGSLILFQGLLGWYMVKSGLEEKSEPDGVARVSQYRLAAHLGTAFILYSLMLWSGLNHLLPPQYVEATAKMRRFWKFTHGAKSLIFLTAFSGAFVAGIEAGLIYNSFPKMADCWIPSDILALSPKWRNITENPTTVQFNHRILGETVFCVVTSMWLYSRKLCLPPRARLAMNCMFVVAVTQVGLGIFTLLFQVPKSLAASHQAGALTLLSTAIWLSHELKPLRFVPK